MPMSVERTYRARIAAIAKRPGCDQVFGAGDRGHKFELTPHSSDEIALFEEQLGVRLPEEYIRLLMETGSGAGPFYGLFAPGRVLAEIELWNGVSQKESTVSPSASTPFPFLQSDADKICVPETIFHPEAGGRATWPSDGCIPICCEGCSGMSALVTAGELRGKIWAVDTDGLPLAGWWPHARPPGMLPEWKTMAGKRVIGFQPRRLPLPPRPPTFLQWYESWLERVEADLDDYEDFKQRNSS
jgi:hypothetical protein